MDKRILLEPSKEIMDYFTVEYPLVTEKYQSDYLDKLYKLRNTIFRALLFKYEKSFNKLKQSNEYIEAIVNRNYSKLFELLEKCNLTKQTIMNDAICMFNHFASPIAKKTIYMVANKIWKIYLKSLLNNKTLDLKYKLNNDSLELVNNVVKDTNIKLLIPRKNKTTVLKVRIKPSNQYQVDALKNEIITSRIKRRFIKTRYKYYVQVVFKGIPPEKYDKIIKDKLHKTRSGDVGLDIGVATVAISSEYAVYVKKIITSKIQEQEIKNIQRKIKRSKDKALKEFNKAPIYSNNYRKLLMKIKNMYRIKNDEKKYQIDLLANFILSLGDNIYVERMNFNKLKERSNINEKNVIQKKKGFGKSISYNVPSKLLDAIDYKLKKKGQKLKFINTAFFKASQYDHYLDEYHKAPLTVRWKKINQIVLHRDLYSAFLIMNVSSDLKTIDKEKCKNRFDKFVIYHNEELKRNPMIK